MTLYQSLFSIGISICDRFHMNPFQLNREKAIDVIYMLNDLIDYSLIQKKKEPEMQNGKQVIERPAGDDWF